MARDYSTRRNNRGKSATTAGNKRKKNAPTRKRHSAAKKNTRRKNTGTPKWVWAGCILFVGIAVGAVAWIATRPIGHPGRDLATTEVPQPQKTAAVKQTASKASQKQQQPEFDFYKMLPDYKVVIPGEMDKIRQRGNSDNNGATAPTQQSDKSENNTAASNTTEHYIIQVGAFTNSKDANQLRARVTLLGLQAKVVHSKNESGQMIYRVRSTVINSGSRLSELLKRLHDQNIETLVLRRRK